MTEIRCPNCGQIFSVSEDQYSELLKQVKNEEFEKEVKRVEEKERVALDGKLLLKEKDYNEQLNKLTNKYEARIKENELKITELERRSANSEELLTERLNTKDQEAKVAIAEATKARDQEIAELKGKLELAKSELNLAISQKDKERGEELSKKDIEIATLKSEAERTARESEKREKEAEERHKKDLAEKDNTIAYYKDYKTRLSTKMIGESLEVYCHNEFNKLRMAAFPNAYFEKDNTVVDGTKGDFIYRDYLEGEEFISIMFEMKNEADSTLNKHKNEDFFDKLDKDRRKKGCEYAVLVTMLEPDNDYYNGGIVDVSYRYERMYVIRPQVFIPFITMLRNEALKSVQYKRALIAERTKNIDVTSFEGKLIEFKDNFGKNLENAKKKYDEAIDNIDKAIKFLTEVKKNLSTSMTHLNAADKKVDGLTIKRLTKENPTMKQLFDDLHKNSSNTLGEEDKA